MTTASSRDWTAPFAVAALSVAGVTMVGAIATAAEIGPFAGGTSSATEHAGSGGTGPVEHDDDAVADPTADPDEIQAAAAEAMAAVTSVEFALELSGHPIYIDQFEAIALDSLIGQFTVPRSARASLDVEVDGSLRTRIGAIALDDEVWISNPVTGDFETLPDGYDIDPSRFFDPEDGWQPLLANLADVSLVGIDDRGGQRYHLRGTAPASEVRNVTAGLVKDQDVPVDLWVHPQSWLVTAAEFTTVIDGGETHWTLELERYGDRFEIDPPENLRETP
jgi:hypothetical protein